MKEINRRSDQRYSGAMGIMSKVDQGVYDAFTEMMKRYHLTPPQGSKRQFAIAAIVINPRDERTFLAVKRPPQANSLPDVWGLPALTLRPEEKVERAVERLAGEKLDTAFRFLGCLGFRTVDRGDHELTLMDVVVTVAGGEPSVWKAPTKQTKYVDQQWTNDLVLLQEAALKGSVCSQILLEAQNFTYAH